MCGDDSDADSESDPTLHIDDWDNARATLPVEDSGDQEQATQIEHDNDASTTRQTETGDDERATTLPTGDDQPADGGGHTAC